jgi:hypothetical protein
MPAFLRQFAVAAVALISAGCFSSQTVIKVHADGSGTIEQTNLVNATMLSMAAGMAKSMTGDKGQSGDAMPKPEDLFTEDQLRKQADEFGIGVKYVSSERVTQGELQGAKATYSFEKVEGLTVGGSQIRNGSMPSGAPAPRMRFALSSEAGQNRLTVTFPDPQPGEAPSSASPSAAQTQQIPPEALALVKPMFEGARVGIEVEVDGRIVGTNAPASSGSRATLLEVDFGELLSDPSKLQALQALKPGIDFATVKRTLEGVKGVKMPAEPKVTIDFAR